jgi:hypothetical protein
MDSSKNWYLKKNNFVKEYYSSTMVVLCNVVAVSNLTKKMLYRNAVIKKLFENSILKNKFYKGWFDARVPGVENES